MAIVERNTHIQPRYKQTEVGVIPEDWDAKQIRDVCSLINGRGFKPHEWQTIGLPIIRIQNLNGSEDFNYYSGPYSPKILIEHGQLLFAWSGSRGTSFGPHVWNGGRALLNYHTWKVVVNESRVNPHFLLHALRQLTGYIETKAHGASALVHVQKWEMEKFLVPIPSSLPEQRAIATALSDVDALITSLDKLIAKKRDIKQATMQQLLTGKTRLPGFGREQKPAYKQTEVGVIPEDWKVKKVGDICDFVVPGRNKPENFDGDIPWITTPDIEGNIVTVSKRELYVTKEEAKRVGSKIVTKNSVVMSCVGDLGLVTIAGRDIVINQQLHAFLPNETINPYYLRYTLIRRKNYMESVATKTAVPYMNKDNCNSIPIPVPAKAEQQAIATILSAMDAEIVALEQRRDKTRTLKQGMMQELLTGKTRLL